MKELAAEVLGRVTAYDVEGQNGGIHVVVGVLDFKTGQLEGLMNQVKLANTKLTNQ